jgi:hypothetical protein
MPDVFLSYGRSDAQIAERLRVELEAKRISVFTDHSLAAGENWQPKILRELESSNAVVVLLSSNTKRDSWVQDEISYALENKGKVIPVLLDEGGINNWVWPLVSDRQAIRLESEKHLPQLAAQIQYSLQGERLARGRSTSPSPLKGRPSIASSSEPLVLEASALPSPTKRRAAVLIAIVAALFGALMTLLLLR